MTVALGIDTGGTYTDAVLVDHDSGQVLSGAKALTTYHDLSLGIGQAVAAAFEGAAVAPSDVALVALSSTLATNAIVEGRGSPVCLLLVGYDPGLIEQYGLEHELVTDDVVYVRGGHDGLGDEIEPLDEQAVREAVLARQGRVEAFSVSGYFGVRNPEHELRVRELIEELVDLPVTCGHELTTRLNAVRRATTATLNARLIPLLRELIATVRQALGNMGIAAPLMVVRGDGSLVRAEWAMQRPIETILSGPAASVVGTWHLAGRQDAWVVDVGGTTTDIAALRDGRPRVNPEGAQVGQWRTMVEAVDVHTVGLGGDSEVYLDNEGELTVGPRRVVPLCVLAQQEPQVLAELQRQMTLDNQDGLTGQFVLKQRNPSHAVAESEGWLLDALEEGPLSLVSLTEQGRYGILINRQVRHLERQRLVLRAGFTPTDALHVLGRFECWDREASRLGAALLATRANTTPEALCEQVVSTVSDRVTTELVTKVLSDEVTMPDWERETAARAMLARALGYVPTSDLGCQLTLRHAVVAIGAPVEAYLPRVAEQLGTDLVIPPHAGVANALGAVAGGVLQQVKVLIRPLDGDTVFRVHLPEGIRDFENLNEAVAYAEGAVTPYAEALARQAGAGQVEVNITRTDREVPVALGWGQEIYLDTELTFTAMGRPSLLVGV
ncbi:MAG: hydantoinase/oxoprolinase family protein [Anaerolineales bacterium]|nr:hydantoinase/oxoprolinase family protein [Anaerolineales bacterium]